MKKLISAAALAICAAVLISACSGEEDNSSPHECSLPYTAGKTSDNVYTSEFFGITASFGDSWELEAGEKLMKRNNVDEWSDSALIEAMDKYRHIFDLSAVNAETSASVIIYVTHSPQVLQNDIDEESTMKDLMKSMISDYSTGPYLLTQSSVNPLVFAGESHYSVDLTILYVANDSVTYQKIVSVVQGDFVASVNISSPDMEELEKITESFSAIGG